MDRRFVSLLLLPCVLLSQALAFGHSHGGSEWDGHESRPHVHIHAHSHGGRAHVHKHHAGHADGYSHDSKPTAKPGKCPVVAQIAARSNQEHDSSAVFLKRAELDLSKRPLRMDQVSRSKFWPVVLNWNGNPIAAQFLGERRLRMHAPPLRGSDCPLFLRHLAVLV
ncbi:hypothetical protein BH10PLA2_BH10PLA2_21870 [soil metagenome]